MKNLPDIDDFPNMHERELIILGYEVIRMPENLDLTKPNEFERR